MKEDEATLSQRIKEELGDEYSENPLVIRDRVSLLFLFSLLYEQATLQLCFHTALSPFPLLNLI